MPERGGELALRVGHRRPGRVEGADRVGEGLLGGEVRRDGGVGRRRDPERRRPDQVGRGRRRVQEAGRPVDAFGRAGPSLGGPAPEQYRSLSRKRIKHYVANG